MAIISRIKTWVAEVLTPADLNAEFNNLVNFVNNVDGATTTWTNVKVTTLTSTTTTTLKGSITADVAAAGNIGEVFYSSVIAGSAVSSTGTGQWTDITNIALTAGDWDVVGQIVFNLNGATMTKSDGFIGTVVGNDATGLISGDNELQGSVPTSVTDTSVTIAAYHVKLNSTTTYYLKGNATFSAGTPKFYGRISARRPR